MVRKMDVPVFDDMNIVELKTSNKGKVQQLKGSLITDSSLIGEVTGSLENMNQLLT